MSAAGPQCTEADWLLARSAGLLVATPGTNTQDKAIGAFADAVRAVQCKRIDFALAELRMAYDLRNAGDIEAREYERRARRALAVALAVPYDLLREEGTRKSEVPA